MGIKKDFGSRVKEIRISRKLTQSQLAEKIGIDPKHMSYIETGGSFPKSDLIEKIADALDINYTELFRINCLQSREKVLEKINRFLSNANEQDIKKVYKIILALFN